MSALPAERKANARADLSVFVEALGDARIDRGPVANHRAELKRRGISPDIAGQVERLARQEAIAAKRKRNRNRRPAIRDRGEPIGIARLVSIACNALIWVAWAVAT